jgi:predicted HNH restriction endonuclease
MPVPHDNSTATGKDLCDSFFNLLAKRIPDLVRAETKQGCAFQLPGEARLVHVWHLKTKDSIKVWPRADSLRITELESFIDKLGLMRAHRKKGSKRWGRFPLPIELGTHEDIEKAVEVLQFASEAKNKADARKARKTGGKLKSKNADQYEPLADELPEPELFPEGGRKTIIVNAYERSSRARNLCIRQYGLTCRACGLDFEQRYGKLGKGFIHVHHIVGISKIGKEYQVDAKTDLRPVCPNCHAMLHRTDPPMSIETLKALLAGG